MFGGSPGGIAAVGSSTATAAAAAHGTSGAIDRAFTPVPRQRVQGHRGLLQIRRKVIDY